MNISDRFASQLMAHSIDLGRFESHEREVLFKIFRDLERALLDQLRRVDPAEPTLTAFQQQRAEKLLTYVRPIIASYYRDMFVTSRRDLQGLALTEAPLLQELGSTLVVDTLFSVGVPEATLKVMVNDLLIQGSPLREWWSRQGRTTLQRYGDTIRIGILRGDSTGTMVRTLQGTRARRFEDGILHRSVRDIHTLVRTSVNAVANESRLLILRANADVLRGMEWLTALDKDVCPQYCVPLSQQSWTLEGQRMPGTTLPFPGPPPRHP